jgi:hypothetical protein
MDDDRPYDLYGGLPPHVKDSETSKEAAESMVEQAKAIREKIYRMIEAKGIEGLTVDEIERLAGYPHQTASARVTELLQEERIEWNHEKRETQHGRKACVWVVTGKAPPKPQLGLFDKP